MPVNDTGHVVMRDNAAIRRRFIEAIRSTFGSDVNVTKSGPIMEFFDAVAQIPLAEVDQDLVNLQLNLLPDTATYANFEKIVAPFGFVPDEATRATGSIQAPLSEEFDPNDPPTSPDPFFVQGDLTFVDVRGERYVMQDSVAPPEEDPFVIPIRAENLGAVGNAEPGTITKVEFLNAAVETRWQTWVASFENEGEITGGFDREPLRAFRNRVRFARAARPSSTLNGLEEAARVSDPGISGVRGIENTNMVTQTRDTLSLHDGDSDSSESIGGTNTRIATLVTTTDRRFVQHVALKLNTNNSFIGVIRIETDDDGEPSGSLVHSGATGSFEPVGTDRVVATLQRGEYLEPGTYHIVVQRESGDGAFAGTDNSEDLVHIYDGSWSSSSDLGELHHELIGGVPPKGFRLFISGTIEDEDAVARAIGTSRSAGIQSDGLQLGTWTNRAGQTVTERWDQPIQVPVVISATVEVTEEFDQDENHFRDILVQHVGGADTIGNIHPGEGVGKSLIRQKLISRLLNRDLVVGTNDVTEFLLARKSVHATPGDLPGGATSNLEAALDEEFVVEDLDDIEITIVVP
jgi:hypothetical protein